MNYFTYRLLSARELLDHKLIDVGNFEYVHQHLSLGGHTGNHFGVVLRNIRPKVKVDNLKDVITSSLESAEKCGFVNYFGLQRFGLQRFGLNMPPAPRVGLAMIQNNVVSHLYSSLYTHAYIHKINTFAGIITLDLHYITNHKIMVDNFRRMIKIPIIAVYPGWI